MSSSYFQSAECSKAVEFNESKLRLVDAKGLHHSRIDFEGSKGIVQAGLMLIQTCIEVEFPLVNFEY